MQIPQGLLPLHAPPLAGVPGDEAGAAHRRGRHAVRRHLPRRAYLRPQASGAGGAQRGRARPPADPERRPHGEDRGPAHGRHALVPLRLHAPGAGVDGVGELGRGVARDLGLQPRRRLLPAVRRRRVAGPRRAPGGGVRARGRQRAAAAAVAARRGQPRRPPLRHRHRQLLRVNRDPRRVVADQG